MSRPIAETNPLLTWRTQFPIVEKTTYLVSHSLGAMPGPVRDELQAYADLWEERGVHAWSEGWWEMPVTVGDLLAPLIGAPAGTVSMHMNVTLAQAIFLSSIDWTGKRNRLVCTDLDFPSVLYLYEGLRAQGAEIVRVPSDDDRTIDPARIAEAIDDRTAVAAFSHVIFRTGALVSVEPIVAAARRHGAVTLLDAYQSVGTVPIDVEAMGIDALSGGSVKWLCGGPGAGYLYVSSETRHTHPPRLTGWQAHESPFEFDPAPMVPAQGSFRYLNGTPGIPALYAARAGYRILKEIGVPTIRKRSLALTQRLIEAADQRSWPIVTPRSPEKRGGTLVLQLDRAQQVCEELGRRGVHVDFRPGVGLRFGPHFYNNESDIDRAVAETEDVLASV